MTQYCQPGQSPKVYYHDARTNTFSIWEGNKSPIDVSITTVDNPNLPNQIYAWNFSTLLNPRTTLDQLPFRAVGKLTDFKVVGIINTDTFNGRQIANYSAQFRDGNNNLIIGSAVGYYPGDEPTLEKILIPDSDKSPQQICKLTIKDVNNVLLFSYTGYCPIEYHIACEGCPDGFLKCSCNQYPGYCCISCSEVKTGLSNILADIRRINNG